MIVFKCADSESSDKEPWEGTIENHIRHEGYHEFWIQSRSSIMTIVGKTSRGNFACMPDYGVGCHLSRFNDLFWNTERLMQLLRRPDGISAAAAIKAFAASGVITD